MITDYQCWKHLTKQPSKQKVTQSATECVSIFKTIILAFVCASIAENLLIDSLE